MSSNLQEYFHKKMQSPTVIVDTSYIIYHTMYSVWGWYKDEFSPPLDGTHEPINSDEYRKAFEVKFKNNISAPVMGVGKRVDYSNYVFAFDAPKSKLWRNAFFDGYKYERRIATGREFNYDGTFKYVKNIIVPSMAEAKGSKVVSIPTVEGDDIIGVIARHIKGSGAVIIANDRDFIQLLSDETLTIVNCMGRKFSLKDESDYPQLGGRILTAEEYLLKKVLTGDKSDGIPSVFPRCGDITAIKYVNNIDSLTEELEKNPVAKEQYTLNSKLMDFDWIPKSISRAIIKEYNKTDYGKRES